MPGIENFAPERTDTSSGFSADPSVSPVACSSLLQVREHLLLDRRRQLALVLVVDRADAGGDREAGRHRQAALVISASPAPLPPSTIAHRAVAFGLALAEEVDVLRAFVPLTPSTVVLFVPSCSCASCRSSSLFSSPSVSGLRCNDFRNIAQL